MLTEPDTVLSSSLPHVLNAAWDLRVRVLEYLPVGFGSHHWVARNDNDGQCWFVTVDDLDAKRRFDDEPSSSVHDRLRSALATASAVRDHGLEFVVAPLLTADGDVVARVTDRFSVAVYPHVEGTHGTWREFESRAERLAVLDLVADLHGCPRHAFPDARLDDFAIPRREDLHAAIDDLDGAWDTGPFGAPAKALLARHVAAVGRLLPRYDQLADAQRGRPERMVLTHGEPHIANTIVTPDGWLLVDWDTALIAPPERDLWHVAGDDTAVLDAYAARTGSVVLPDALDCYRLSWDLSEIALYVALLRREHDDSADVRESWKNLNHYLDPARRWPELM